MSRIDKLEITGVRSFDPNKQEVIKFEPPLTLVAGFNGSGKTTIIECLKFAATGILPPGSKQQGAFIHDPGLTGDRQVKAQVKMQFHSTHGARMVVVRTLELQIKKASRSQKTLDSSLLTEREGQRHVLSSRVAELDSILPSYLGVSSSVLENVIFCHQEDSLWPLADSSTLKKKFDDIFDATKHTKAVEELKKIRKKHREELGKLEVLEGTAKKDRDRARKVKTRCYELERESEELKEKAADLQRKMHNADTLAMNARTESEEYAMVLGKLEGYRIEANGKENTIKDLKVHLKTVSETDDELEGLLSEFDATLAKYGEDRRVKKEQWLEMEDSLKNSQDQLSIKSADKGKYEQEKEQYERQLESRRRMVKDAANRHQMRGFSDVSNDTLVEEFLYKIKKMAKERTSALERTRRDADTEKRESQTLINRLTERKKALQDNKITAKRQIALTDREAVEYQKRADQVGADEGGKAVLESRIDDLNQKLQRERETSTVAKREARLKDAESELKQLEGDYELLNNELVQGTKKASEIARLGHIKQELKDKQRSLQTLIGAHGDRIRTLIGAGWTPQTIEEKFEASLEKHSQLVTTAEREREVTARELEFVQFKLKSNNDERTEKTLEAQQCEQLVKDAIDGEICDYDEALSSVQARVDFARDKAQGVGGLAEFFTNVLETANSREACRLCGRAFKGPKDDLLIRFKDKITNLIERASKDEGEADLNDALAEHKAVMEAGVSYEQWKTLTQSQLPMLKSEMETLSAKRKALNIKLEAHDKNVEDEQTAKKELETITKTVSSITKTDGEIQALSAQIDALTENQPAGTQLRTLEDIQAETTQISDRIRSLKQSIATLNTEANHAKSEVYAMELQLRDFRNELGTMMSQLEKKASFLARIEEFKGHNKKQWEIIEKADSDIENIEPEVATAQAKYDDVNERWNKRIDDLTRESSEISETVNALNMLNESINSYEESNSAGKLSTTIRDIKNLQQNIEQTKGSQAQLTREISKLGEQLHDAENTKRKYSDNLRYRQETRALGELRKEITELESRDAHIDRERLQKEADRRTREYHKFSGEREGVIGELKSKDGQLWELREEYKTDLSDAATRYQESRIKVETTKAAVEDIGRYSTALDRAIMKFHTLKMEEVNGIIEELWRETYQGTDVDTIYIRSDMEAKATTRSHNYRVVMVKRDVEMDMRGRCSAGQKVLASIIIRLALAECFSMKCGVIALDEPTTNLDSDNIQALARSLHKLIRTRQAQKNFQLIIITHDEEFLKQMHCADFTSHYYRVSRDSDENSTIEQNSIVGIL